ncbi:MAG: carbonic anhydrase [Candidatus Eisenbacteria bacterium]|nr:carbonic anhydrase [Candidatus Eisenbacteria bacterium]
MTVSAQEALERLREGNRRFVSGNRGAAAHIGSIRWNALVEGQSPIAAVLACSDSRAPVEIVFDQGPGDLFVVRVAGNIAGPSQIGSIEFAAERFGTRLVVVLGHTRCGAVRETVETVRSRREPPSENLRAIIDRIRPTVEGLLAEEPGLDPDALARRAVRENVRASVLRLRQGSSALRSMMKDDRLVVAGAVYSLETGAVDFLDDPPEAR